MCSVPCAPYVHHTFTYLKLEDHAFFAFIGHEMMSSIYFTTNMMYRYNVIT